MLFPPPAKTTFSLCCISAHPLFSCLFLLIHSINIYFTPPVPQALEMQQENTHTHMYTYACTCTHVLETPSLWGVHILVEEERKNSLKNVG